MKPSGISYRFDPEALAKLPPVNISEQIYRDALERVLKGEAVRITWNDQTIAFMHESIPISRWFRRD